MKFTFIEKKMAPSGSLRAYAEKKVSKIDRLFRTESEANVTFSTERGRFTAEITIKNNGTFFRAHETTSDMYASVIFPMSPNPLYQICALYPVWFT